MSGSELTRHVALALSQYLDRLRRAGLHAPPDVEELAAVLGDLSRHWPHAPVTPREQAPERLLVTRTEAAERLSVSVRTVDRLVATGALPQVQIGRLPRFRVVDVEEYVRGLGRHAEPE